MDRRKSLSKFKQVENPDADHGDYWGWNTKAKPLRCAQHAAQLVREHLRFPSAGARRLPARELPVAELSETRAVQPARALKAREG